MADAAAERKAAERAAAVERKAQEQIKSVSEQVRTQISQGNAAGALKLCVAEIPNTKEEEYKVCFLACLSVVDFSLDQGWRECCCRFERHQSGEHSPSY